MAFWSSQTLENRLNLLITPADPGAVDCNAITLRMGREFYATPSLENKTPGYHTKTLLSERQPFAIPAGQFAFLLTEESVHVPKDAMAFISMKARMKFRGLVNVSGFHVDPGWSGPLIFAVFNAGPATVHLEQGMPLFLVWYADLDEASAKHKKTPGPTAIPPDLINNITGELNSFSSLAEKIDSETEKLSDRIHAIEKNHVRIRVIAAVVLSILVGVVGFLLRGAVEDWWKARPSAATAAAPAQTTPSAAPPAPTPQPQPDSPTDQRTPPQ